MSVFQIDKNFEVILNKDALKLVPELSSLNQDEIRYIILTMDYVDSPLRKRPLNERRMMAKRMVYGDQNLNPETDRVLAGMELYKSLVFDIRRETADIYKIKIKKLQKESLMPDVTFQRMKEIDSSISFMQDRVAKIEHDLDIEEKDSFELKGQKELSYLERWQRKQREYHEYMKKS